MKMIDKREKARESKRNLYNVELQGLSSSNILRVIK
jgi:hypothetical protein